MKKIILMITILLSAFILVGCGKYGEKDIIKDLKEKMKACKKYNITGELTIYNNENKYKYDVSASYKKDNYYRVSLKNKINNHEQIIIRNKNGVYVLTPSLNKSFKFQSEWPFNSSQTYLLQTLYNDIKNDNNRKFKETKKRYIFTVGVDYPNNPDLIKQKIYFDKKLNIKKVEIYNKKGNIQMLMMFDKVDYKPSFKKNYFELKENMNSVNTNDDTKTVSKVDDIIYPMYMPKNTHLDNEEIVKKGTNGERVILTYGGDKSFMFIQETASKEKDLLTIPVFGEPEIITESVAAISDNSISWMSDGMEYFITSDKLSTNELLEVVKSVSTMPVGK